MKYKEIHFPTIDSTNLYIKQHYKELDDLTIVSSDYQSAGKGRNDRTWLSKSGDNLLFSLLVKNPKITIKGGYLSLIAATSVVQILENRGFDGVFIKWPNDIYLGDKKVSGILLEGQLPDFLVIGIGLNVNQDQFLGEYHIPPTSLYLESNKKIDIASLKKDIFENLINNVKKTCESVDEFKKYFDSHNYLLNKKISFILNGKKEYGDVIGVNDDFSLLIKTQKGIISIQSGEVSITLEK